MPSWSAGPPRKWGTRGGRRSNAAHGTQRQLCPMQLPEVTLALARLRLGGLRGLGSAGGSLHRPQQGKAELSSCRRVTTAILLLRS